MYKTVTVGTDISDSDIDTQIAEAYEVQHFCVNNEDQIAILATNYAGSYLFKAGRFEEFERDYEIEEA